MHNPDLPQMNDLFPDSADSRRLVLWLLFGVVLLVYTSAANHEFLNIDNDLYVTQNWRVQEGLSWENVKWALVALEAGFWHPLTWLTHMADCQFYGLTPRGHHVTNLVIHAVNVGVLFWVLQQMTGALWCSAVVAGMFGLHPLNVESVAWVVQRGGGGDVWVASAQCGVGGLGGGAQECAEYVVLAADDVGVFEVCEEAELGKVWGDDGGVCGGADGQADAGDAALCAAAAGLLAAEKMGGMGGVSREVEGVGAGEGADAGAGGSGECAGGGGPGANRSADVAGRAAGGSASGQRGGELRAVFKEDGVAGGFGGVHPGQQLPVWWVVVSCVVLVGITGVVPVVVVSVHPGQQLPVWWVVVSCVVLVGITGVVLWRGSRSRYLVVGWLWYLGTMFLVSGVVQVGGTPWPTATPTCP